MKAPVPRPVADPVPRPGAVSDRTAALVIGGGSVAILAFLFWLIYVNAPSGTPPAWASWLPGLNAVCNACSALCVLGAVIAIRRRNVRVHVGLIAGALAFSAMFLIGYVAHHAFHGDTRFGGAGWIRPVYFSILISHILLSMAVVPLVLTTVFIAVTGRFATHRKVARWTFPVWLYVSVTGVAIYLFLSASGG